jgi:Tfp pilus assembly protein FimT
MKYRKAFSNMEIIIALSILTLLISISFSLFNSYNKSVVLTSMRSDTQKAIFAAQNELDKYKE